MDRTCDCPKVECAEVLGAARGYVDATTGSSTGSFSTYVVRTVLSDSSTTTVYRRYSDFEALAAYFERARPYTAAPPVPEKAALPEIERVGPPGSVEPGVTQAHALVEYRVRAFGRFLALLLAHRELADDHVVHVFLANSDPGAFRSLSAFGAPPAALPRSSTPRIGRSAEGLVAELHARVIPHLDEAARTLDVQMRAVLLQRRNMAASCEELSAAYSAFALEHASLSVDLQALSQKLHAEASLQRTASDGHQLAAELARDAVLSLPSIRRALRNIVLLHADYDALSERVNVARSDVLRPGGPARAAVLALEAQEDTLRSSLVSYRDSFVAQLRVWASVYLRLWDARLSADIPAAIRISSDSLSVWRNAADSACSSLTTPESSHL